MAGLVVRCFGNPSVFDRRQPECARRTTSPATGTLRRFLLRASALVAFARLEILVRALSLVALVAADGPAFHAAIDDAVARVPVFVASAAVSHYRLPFRVLVHALLRRNRLDFVGQRLAVHGAIVDAHPILGTAPSKRVLHPDLVVAGGIVLAGMGTAALRAIGVGVHSDDGRPSGCRARASRRDRC